MIGEESLLKILAEQGEQKTRLDLTNSILKDIKEILLTQVEHDFRISENEKDIKEVHNVTIPNLDKRLTFVEKYKWMFLLVSIIICSSIGYLVQQALVTVNSIEENKPMTEKALIRALEKVFPKKEN